MGHHVRELKTRDISDLWPHLEVFARESALMMFMTEHPGTALIHAQISLLELMVLLFSARFRHDVPHGILIIQPTTVPIQHCGYAIVVGMKRAGVLLQ